MDHEKMRKLVQDTVDALLADKDKEAAVDKLQKEMESKLETAAQTVTELNDQLSEVTKDLTDKASKVEELETKNSVLTDTLKTKEEEITSLNKSLIEVSEQKESLDKELSELKKDQVLSDRIEKLTELQVLRKEEALEAQKAAVRDMSDSEFDAYADTLSAIRADILDSLTEELANKGSNKEEEETDGDEVIPPMNVEGAAREAASLPNVPRTKVSQSKVWKKFGDTLASKMKQARNRDAN